MLSKSERCEVDEMWPCCKSLLLEFYYTKLCFFHHNWKAFTYTPVRTLQLLIYPDLFIHDIVVS